MPYPVSATRNKNFGVQGPSSLLNGIVAYWKLDEFSNGSGAVTRVDSAGSSNLTDVNTTASTTGKISNAALFVPASSERLFCADNTALSMGDIDFTIAGWINSSDTTKSGGLCNKWDVTQEYVLWLNGGGTMKMTFTVNSSGGSVQADNIGALANNTWYFVVAWHDSVGNTLNIQVNDGTPDSSSYSGGVPDSNSNFSIGTVTTGGAFNTITGIVDEVGIWKRVLTAAERTVLYNGGAGNTYPF